MENEKHASIWDYPREVLCPEIWDVNNNVIPEIKRKIIDHLYFVLNDYGMFQMKIWIKNIRIIGSIAGYQYNNKSDVDVHIDVDIAKFQETEQLKNEIESVDKLKQIRKHLNMEDVLVVGGTHPVEYTFEMPGYLSATPYDGNYDLLNDKWIMKPNKHIPELTDNKDMGIINDINDVDKQKYLPDIIAEIKAIATELDINIGELKRDVTDANYLDEMVEYIKAKESSQKFIFKLKEKLVEIENDIKQLSEMKDEIVENRKQDYKPNSKNNLIFKAIQRYNYLTIISKLEKFIKDDKQITPDELPEIQEITGGQIKCSNMSDKDLEGLTEEAKKYKSTDELGRKLSKVISNTHTQEDPLFNGNVKSSTQNIVKETTEQVETTEIEAKTTVPGQSIKESYFEMRTQKHIDSVKKYCKKIQSAYPNKFYNLNDMAEFHDKSKFVEPERTPYISLTWKKFVAENSKDNEKSKQKPTKEENEATLHHIISNSHHPEYWCGRVTNLLNINDRDKQPSEIVDATKMPDINIAEMVADWCAMSEELDNSPFDWASMNINKRWYFNGNQIALIYKLLEVVWDVNIKDNNKNNVNINNKNNIKDNNKDNVNIEDKNIDIKNIDYISKNIDNNIIHNINNTINNIDISSAKSLGGNVGNADDAYIKDELEKGIDVELEHTPKKEIAKEIAKDHLDEIPDYYTRLIKMEEEAMKLKKDKEASSEVNNNFQSELAYVKAKAKEVDEYLRQRIVEYQEEGISEEEYFDKIEQEIFTKYHLNSETYSLLMKHL